MNTNLIAFTAIVFYATGGTLLAVRLFRGPSGILKSKIAPISIGLVAVLLHAFTLYHGILTVAGLNLGLFNAVSLIAWIIALLLVASSLTKPVENLGIVFLPLAALSIALSIAFPSNHLVAANSGRELHIHILLSMLAYSMLSLAAMQAVLLAIQNHHLHSRQPGGFIRSLPPLQTMETLLFEMIWVGFFLLTMALSSGFMFLDDMFAQKVSHKTVRGLVSWIVFGTLLWGRHRYGWRGQTAIIWTLSGFAVLMVGYVGSKVVLEFILEQ